jgi:HK97 family phage prohead protease
MMRRIQFKTAATTPTLHVARFAVKASEGRQFTGLASTWDLDEGGDLILPGAYATTLGEWKAQGRVIPLINQHNYYDARHAIGKMVAAEETQEGLVSTFQVVNSPDGNEFLARIKDGILDGLSIGYSVRKWRPPSDAERKLGVQRVLEEIELREVSVVIWGMNPNALIDTASVKSLADSLAQLKRETLTEDERKTLRQIASRCGALLRPDDQPPAPGVPGAAAAGATGEQAPPPPTAPPGGESHDPAAAPKAYANTDALAQRLLALRLAQTVSHARTTGRLIA